MNQPRTAPFQTCCPPRRTASARRRRTSRPPTSPAAGFSLIEMIGALALVGIFAAIVTPNLAQSVSRSNGAKEDERLVTLGDGLVDSILQTQVIPAPATWAAAVAKTTGLSSNEVRFVIPSDASTARVYLIDPSFAPADITASTLSSSPSTAALWTQSANGASTVSNARLLILSVHKPGLTLPVSSGFASSTTAFENIWNWTLDPRTDAPPAGWSSTWNGNGEYLHVRRINLLPYFHRLTFSNTEYPTESPYYRLGTSSAVLLNSSTGFDALYLRGSLVRVYAANNDSSTPGDLQITHTVTGSGNFFYADGAWEPN